MGGRGAQFSTTVQSWRYPSELPLRGIDGEALRKPVNLQKSVRAFSARSSSLLEM